MTQMNFAVGIGETLEPNVSVFKWLQSRMLHEFLCRSENQIIRFGLNGFFTVYNNNHIIKTVTNTSTYTTVSVKSNT